MIWIGMPSYNKRGNLSHSGFWILPFDGVECAWKVKREIKRVLSAGVGISLLATVMVCGATLGVLFRNTIGVGNSVTNQNANVFTVAGRSGLTHLGGSGLWAVVDNSDKLVEPDVILGRTGSISATAITGPPSG